MAEKGWVPLRYWLIWYAVLPLALAALYVLLTPLWMSLRAAAWAAEIRSRTRR